MPRLTVALIPAFTLLALLPAQRYGSGEGAAPKLENFTFEEGTLKSDKARGGDAGYGIYLPKGYADAANKDTKYPWILWLHGFGGAGEFQQGHGVLDKLRGEGKIPPLVMVVFRGPTGRTTYMNGEPGGDIEDLIVGDLMKHLADKYHLQSDKGQRALMGVSMGGLGAMKIAMHHPEMFGTVAVHSAAILPADPTDVPEKYRGMVKRQIENGGLDKVFGNPIDKVKWAEQMPLGIVASKKPADLKGLHIYFDAGTDDRYGFCPPNETLDKVMTEKGFVHLFRKIEGGGHAWSSPSMKECLAVSLQFVGAAFLGKDPIEAMKPKEPAKPPAAPDAKKDEKKDLECVCFTDYGLLSASGPAIRTEAVYLEVPVMPDLTWLWLYQETQNRRQFFFSIRR